MSFWFEGQKRLFAAKQLQRSRIEFISKVWKKDRDLRASGFDLENDDISSLLQDCSIMIEQAQSVNKLLQIEAQFTKRLYKFASIRTQQEGFVRTRESQDRANSFFKSR